jgi:hypothetical protein
MTIEQIVEIPSSRRIFLDLPLDIPLGRARFAATVTPVSETPDAPPGLTLSERLAGSLRLSGEEYELRQDDIRQGRDEWNRNIF